LRGIFLFERENKWLLAGVERWPLIRVVVITIQERGEIENGCCKEVAVW
jgi:hypothetical protein